MSCADTRCRFNSDEFLSYEDKSFIDFSALPDSYQLIIENGVATDTIRLILDEVCNLIYKSSNEILLARERKIKDQTSLHIGDTTYIVIVTNLYQREKEEIIELSIGDFYNFNKSVFNARVYFSWEKGFIGSYLYSNKVGDSKHIVAPAGDILEKLINYEGYTRSVLR